VFHVKPGEDPLDISGFDPDSDYAFWQSTVSGLCVFVCGSSGKRVCMSAGGVLESLSSISRHCQALQLLLLYWTCMHEPHVVSQLA